MTKTEGQRMEQAEKVLNRALDRYDRRADAYVSGDPDSSIWFRFPGPSAMTLVKQARDLAGRLEAMVYDGVGL